MRYKRHQWTKEEIKQVIKVWDSKSIDELAGTLKVKRSAIQGVAGKLRKAGVRLAHKRQNGNLDFLIREVVREIKR